MPTLHVHVDESGNLDFSPTGTRYYVFAVAWTHDPAPLAKEISDLRFQLIKAGHGTNLSGFHASEDPEPRRERLIDLLLTHRSWNFAAIVVDKPRVNPTIREPRQFYPKFVSMLLRFVFRGRIKPTTSSVLIYTDTLPVPKKQAEAAEIAIKASCKAELSIPFHSCHHRMESNAWLQVADYCSWAVCRKWETENVTAYNRLRIRLAETEISPMSRGDGTVYY